MCAAPLAAVADGALAALASIASPSRFADLDAAALLAERALLTGLRRAGRQSAGGACRLLTCADGLIALSLARDDDWSLLPAWLEDDVHDWAGVEVALRRRDRVPLVARGRELGLAVAASEPAPQRIAPWCRIVAGRAWRPLAETVRAPLVVDLSSLWAGPLSSHLLQRAGARVIKVESVTRPDGARRGSPAFFDLLNAGKQSAAFDLSCPTGRAQLRQLLRHADIVIEASRPRALQQMGIDAEALLVEQPGLSWISISGYGRAWPQAQWIGYGDDAAVAAGASDLQQRAGGSAIFIGDALADPLTGLHAAYAAWASHLAGGGRLLELSLVGVVRHALAFARPHDDAQLRRRQQRWTARVSAEDIRTATPRQAVQAAPVLGADTAAVMAEFGLPC
nr:CoA transferase [Solimonas marina]